ncbi:N-carbamoylputrescine amidase [Salvia divinorum]|uniref:N-carbamoylputrescine amidase n=1 Tax=Salvia divinorum TaxID=28513 RepID=A0ABD1GIV7_SALDI
MNMVKSRLVTVSALQFACTDYVPTNVETAQRLVRAAHQKGANIILLQVFAGISGFQRQLEPWHFNVQKYCSIPQPLALKLKMMAWILEITGNG